MATLDSKHKYYWYRNTGGSDADCDLLYIGKGALYGFIEEPDYDIFLKNDLRLVFYGTLEELSSKIPSLKAR